MSKSRPVHLDVGRDLFDDTYKSKEIAWYDLGEPHEYAPNQYVVLVCGDQRLPCKADKDGKILRPINRKDTKTSGIKPRNEEQLLALDAFLDKSVPLVTAIGRTGTGKTLLALAAAIQQVESGRFDGITLVKPMVQIGQDMGALPGTVEEKYSPYLHSYYANLEVITGENHEQALQKYKFNFMPLQLMRGCSFRTQIVILDEAQSLSKHEMLTIATRIGEDSRMFILADFAQCDNGLKREDSGLNYMLEHPLFVKSGMTASVELVKVERSPLVALVSDIFGV